jgi:hypothetical protein
MRIQRIFAALLIALTLSALGSSAPQTAAAASEIPITISFTATVVELNDGAHALGNVQVGDTITGTYTYDAAKSDDHPAPEIGSYAYYTAPNGMRANIGGKVVESDQQDVFFGIGLMNNSNGRDSYGVHSFYNRPLSGQYAITFFGFHLYDPTQTALKNTNLPKTAPKLSDWRQDEGYGFDVSGYDPNTGYEFHLHANVTQLKKI